MGGSTTNPFQLSIILFAGSNIHNDTTIRLVYRCCHTCHIFHQECPLLSLEKSTNNIDIGSHQCHNASYLRFGSCLFYIHLWSLRVTETGTRWDDPWKSGIVTIEQTFFNSGGEGWGKATGIIARGAVGKKDKLICQQDHRNLRRHSQWHGIARICHLPFHWYFFPFIQGPSVSLTSTNTSKKSSRLLINIVEMEVKQPSFYLYATPK